MVKESKSHEADDKKRREEVELRNQADALVYNTEKMIKDNREKIPVGDIKRAEEACEECKKAIEANESSRVKKALEDLQQATFKISEALYKASAPKGEPGAAAAGAEEPKKEEKKKDEKVVDAEFEETK